MACELAIATKPKDFYNLIMDSLDSASKRVYISTFVITRYRKNFEIIDRLRALARKGVDVRVIVNGRGDAYKTNMWLMRRRKELGFPLKVTSKYIHTKLYIFDDTTIIGSHNLSPMRRLDFTVGFLGGKTLTDMLVYIVWPLLESEDTSSIILADTVCGRQFTILYNTSFFDDLKTKIELAEEQITFITHVATLSAKLRGLYKLLLAKEQCARTIVLDGYTKAACKYNVKVCNELSKKGIKVILTNLPLHMKVYAVDNMVVFGSHNLTASSKAGRIELMLSIADDRIARAAHINARIFELYNSNNGCTCSS